jgi:DNA-binding NarL/FixJ family response regulator
VLAVRGQASKLARVIEQSPVPVVMVDNERLYLEANRPARLAFRLSLAEMRKLAIDDLTPESELTTLESAWARLLRTGAIAGQHEVASPNGSSRFNMVYAAMANVLPGHHVIAFALAGWPDDELGGGEGPHRGRPHTELTARELEVLQLAARGFSGPRIAEELVLSRGTVRSHFNNIYTKLGVRDRAGAVAKAMRLELIE